LAIVRNRDVQNFALVIREDPEGGFWAEVFGISWLLFSGDTEDELKHNIREAIAGVLEVLREQG
jgi:predicted RNase H-like HicB family nuclease